MAALIPKTVLQVAKKQTICTTSVGVQVCQYSSEQRVIKSPTTASLKRGTGGRSSFNGVVCTIFGSTGFVGSYLCNRLGKTGTQLIIPYRKDFYEVRDLKLCGDLGQVLFHPFHVRDEDSIRRCIKYSNVVINLLGCDWETKNFTFEDIHVDAVKKIARICKEEGNVERFIHVSSMNVSQNPTPHILPEGSKFLKTKWEGEQVVLDYFPNATIVRPSFIYGFEDRFLHHYSSHWRYQILTHKIPMWEKGTKTELQPIWVGDVAAGITAIVHDRSTEGKIYQFVGPRRYKLSDLILWLTKYFHVNAERRGMRTANIKYHPLYHVKVALSELHPSKPHKFLSWERLERESTSDVVHKDLPTLEDLGIAPQLIESRMHWEAMNMRMDHEVPDMEYFESIPSPAFVATN